MNGVCALASYRPTNESDSAIGGVWIQISYFALVFFLIPRNMASAADPQHLRNITTTDGNLLLEFSEGEVSKANELYIGLTKPQPLLPNFHELFFGITKVGSGSRTPCQQS